MKMKLRLGAAALAGILSVAAIGGSAIAANLNGAGGTAIYPVLQVWAKKYEEQTGIKVNYQGDHVQDRRLCELG